MRARKMKKITHLIATIALLATVGILGGSIGIIDTAKASSNGSHSSHSLAGRFFKIRGEYLPGYPLSGSPAFDNCYTLADDGTFGDPLFPDNMNPANAIPGTWIQHSGGFVRRYTAFAEAVNLFGPGVNLQLIQNGIVTPTWRKGVLYLRAYSTVVVGGEGGGDVLAVILSKGRSVDKDECDKVTAHLPPPT